MQLTERHVIKKTHPNYEQIDKLCFASKNLYNQANYRIRQAFIFEGKYLNYNNIQKQLQTEECYKALPAKVSQQILMVLERNWKSFKEALKVYKENPSTFQGKPKLPKYKDKEKGRNLLVYTTQALSQLGLKKGLIQPSKTEISIPTKIEVSQIAQVRIVPKLDHYVIEVVYNIAVFANTLNQKNVASVDLGVNNLAAVTFNQPGMKPLLINGRPLKSINQYYNKRSAELQAILGSQKATSRRIQRLSTKRNWKIDDYLHKASRYLINALVAQNVGTLIIGKNDGWKQQADMGRQNNQTRVLRTAQPSANSLNFVCIPHARFISQLEYKAQLVGIKLIVTEESYTSKASFLDSDVIPDYQQAKAKPKFSGRRVKRGMYKAKSGRKLNADVNGSFNIMLKAAPRMLAEGVEGVVVRGREGNTSEVKPMSIAVYGFWNYSRLYPGLSAKK